MPRVQRWRGTYGETQLTSEESYWSTSSYPLHTGTRLSGDSSPLPQTLLSHGEGHSQFLPQQVQSSRRGQGGVPEESGLSWPTPA